MDFGPNRHIGMTKRSYDEKELSTEIDTFLRVVSESGICISRGTRLAKLAEFWLIL